MNKQQLQCAHSVSDFQCNTKASKAQVMRSVSDNHLKAGFMSVFHCKGLLYSLRILQGFNLTHREVDVWQSHLKQDAAKVVLECHLPR